MGTHSINFKQYFRYCVSCNVDILPDWSTQKNIYTNPPSSLVLCRLIISIIIQSLVPKKCKKISFLFWPLFQTHSHCTALTGAAINDKCCSFYMLALVLDTLYNVHMFIFSFSLCFPCSTLWVFKPEQLGRWGAIWPSLHIFQGAHLNSNFFHILLAA